MVGLAGVYADQIKVFERLCAKEKYSQNLGSVT